MYIYILLHVDIYLLFIAFISVFINLNDMYITMQHHGYAIGYMYMYVYMAIAMHNEDQNSKKIELMSRRERESESFSCLKFEIYSKFAPCIVVKKKG